MAFTRVGDLAAVSLACFSPANGLGIGLAI